MEVYVDQNPSWMHWIAPEEFNDSVLFKIVVFFYIFHSPCEGLSAMGRSLREHGWNTPWRKPYCLRKQLIDVSTNKELIYSAGSYNTMDKAHK
ncbi:MAG: hypothetical protein LUI06_01265 [Ruminococcus sp.]|nr:hypothetical protein [Ruminococcus sp.]